MAKSCIFEIKKKTFYQFYHIFPFISSQQQIYSQSPTLDTRLDECYPDNKTHLKSQQVLKNERQVTE